MKPARWHIAVLIPACNEEHLLARCLHSTQAATSFVSRSVTVDTILAVDRSTDRTRKIGEAILRGSGIVVDIHVGIVGRARAAAAQMALRRYDGPLRWCWLANTDADSSVPVTWLRDQLDLANMGAEAVAGTIDVDSFEEHAPYVADRFRSTYVIFPDGSHTHVHGANMGVRGDVYQRAGGWKATATAEDHDLWNRLGEIGARRISVNNTRVLTSGRRIGRAPNGFAEALAAHNAPRISI